ncbi:uncharacterized protein A4U43_C08F6440 [Asparagus officinalis]|uniref:protein PGR-like n=1 Tax=Asparagus officinalis TaxID=4686 RepID=UPI00098E06A4|nr:protein PGR-like [Asparagus officinalis]ONK59439.1 uncharacterized protein A4U43_C08F6440 [Asparagus officinalis]
MDPFLIRFVLAVFLSSLIAIRALKRKSLDRSGALAGFLVMAVHFCAGFRFGFLLLVFFFSSSKLTKVGEERKRKLEEDFREGGQRNWVQVLSNSAIATIMLLVLALYQEQQWCLNTKESIVITGLIGGIIGHYACCNGDTWSSEIGILSSGEPRLITTFKKVRKGTNGAVSNEGLLAAAAAGFVVGLAYVAVGLVSAECASDASWRQLLVIPLATASGLLGSLIDSLLGATVQYSGYCNVRRKVVSKKSPTVKRISGVDILDNNAVNAVSILLTSLLTGLACLYIF